MSQKPLTGMRVVEFGFWFAAPQIAKILAAFGAEVIKIEGKTRPDWQRPHPPFKDSVQGLNRGGDFNQLHAGKMSIAVNLAKPKGMEVAKALIAKSDIMVENFAGGIITRMGLGYKEVKKLKPDIIMLSTCMQGQTGPSSSSRGTGVQLTALSGFYSVTGWPDREPIGPSGPYPDYIASRLGTLSILAALDYRRKTGKGQYIDLSQFEGAVHFLSPLILDNSVNQRVAPASGNLSRDFAPHNAYHCSGTDRWCAIAVTSEEKWHSFCKVIGNPSWTQDPRFTTMSARKANEAELDKLVENWTMQYSAEEVMSKMQSSGVGAGVVNSARDILENDPQIKHRNTFQRVNHPEIGEYAVPGFSYQLSNIETRLQRAPLLGEHNEHILKQILGMTDEQIVELVVAGAIE